MCSTTITQQANKYQLHSAKKAANLKHGSFNPTNHHTHIVKASLLRTGKPLTSGGEQYQNWLTVAVTRAKPLTHPGGTH